MGTQLLDAATYNRFGEVKKILAEPNARDIVDEKGSGGRTPLIAAAGFGHTPIVRALLAAGADVDARHAQGWSALLEASAAGHVRVVRALLDAGADVHSESFNEGETALMLAAGRGHVDTARVLVDAGGDPTKKFTLPGTKMSWSPLDMAHASGHKEVEELLLDAEEAWWREKVARSQSEGRGRKVREEL